MVALGSTTFDGFSRSGLWTDATIELTGLGRTVAFTAGLLAVIGLVTLAYVVAMRFAASVVDGDWRPLAVRFSHSLVPIVLAYVVAHYFSFLVLEGQLGLLRLSDPSVSAGICSGRATGSSTSRWCHRRRSGTSRSRRS